MEKERRIIPGDRNRRNVNSNNPALIKNIKKGKDRTRPNGFT